MVKELKEIKDKLTNLYKNSKVSQIMKSKISKAIIEETKVNNNLDVNKAQMGPVMDALKILDEIEKNKNK